MKKLRDFLLKNFEVIRIIAAVFLAIAIIMIVIACVSNQPGDVLYWFTVGPLTSLRRFGTVIELMIPLCFCGIAWCMCFAVNKFNMAVEGSFFIAGTVTAAIALYTKLPGILMPIAIILCAAVAGGTVTLIPAYIDEKYKANIVVCGIMINFVTLYIGRFFLIHYMKDPTFSYNGTPFFPDNAILTRFIKGTRIHTGVFILLIAVVLIYILLYKTKFGYDMRLSGQNPKFARYSGINTRKSILAAQFICGMLAGIGGAVECMGIYQQLMWETQLGYGFDGMLIAIIAKNNPLAVPFVSFLISYIRAGGDLVNRMTDVPVELVSVIQSLIVIFIAAKALLAGWKHLMLKRKSLEEKEATK